MRILENQINNKDPLLQAGIEYQIFPSILLMFGIQSNPNTNRMGFGFSIEKFGVETSWSILSHQILPATQSFSLGYKF